MPQALENAATGKLTEPYGTASGKNDYTVAWGGKTCRFPTGGKAGLRRSKLRSRHADGRCGVHRAIGSSH